MLRIKLIKNYVIDIDTNDNYTLKELTGRNKKTNEETVKYYGYFSNAKECVRKLIKIETNHVDETMTLLEYANRIETISEKVIKELKEMGVDFE